MDTYPTESELHWLEHVLKEQEDRIRRDIVVYLKPFHDELEVCISMLAWVRALLAERESIYKT